VRISSSRRFLFVLWEGGGNVPLQLGLANGLVERGHEVRVLTEDCLAADVGARRERFESTMPRCAAASAVTLAPMRSAAVRKLGSRITRSTAARIAPGFALGRIRTRSGAGLSRD
jgi:hypothetical protein